MTLKQLRAKISRQILRGNLILLGIVMIWYLLPTPGFDDQEFATLLSIIGAISGMYLGVLFQHAGILINLITASVSDEDKAKAKKQLEFNPKLKSVPPLLRWAIPTHFILLVTIISLKPLALIPFTTMTLILGFVEAVFGGFIVHVLTAIYNINR